MSDELTEKLERLNRLVMWLRAALLVIVTVAVALLGYSWFTEADAEAELPWVRTPSDAIVPAAPLKARSKPDTEMRDLWAEVTVGESFAPPAAEAETQSKAPQKPEQSPAEKARYAHEAYNATMPPLPDGAKPAVIAAESEIWDLPKKQGEIKARRKADGASVVDHRISVYRRAFTQKPAEAEVPAVKPGQSPQRAHVEGIAKIPDATDLMRD